MEIAESYHNCPVLQQQNCLIEEDRHNHWGDKEGFFFPCDLIMVIIISLQMQWNTVPFERVRKEVYRCERRHLGKS